jgi:hypothetical protein
MFYGTATADRADDADACRQRRFSQIFKKKMIFLSVAGKR